MIKILGYLKLYMNKILLLSPIIILLLSTSLLVTFAQDKTQLISAVFEDVDENCNLPIGKYSDNTAQTSLEICKKGMAWLKIECDANYDNVELCKENMPAIKTYLTRNNFDERDTQYHHDKYVERLDKNLDISTMTVIQEEKITKGLQTLLDATANMPPLNWTQIEEEKKQKEAERKAQEKRSQETVKELQQEIFGNSCKGGNQLSCKFLKETVIQENKENNNTKLQKQTVEEEKLLETNKQYLEKKFGKEFVDQLFTKEGMQTLNELLKEKQLIK